MTPSLETGEAFPYRGVMKKILALAVLSSCCLWGVAALAQAPDTPAGWMKRILDPESIGVKPYPGSEVSKKVSVDLIRLDSNPRKQVAAYVAPLEERDEVSRHFQETLGVEPMIFGEGEDFERRVFRLTGGGDYPEAAEGLEITVFRSPWVEGKVQMTMEYVPPED